MRLDRRRGRRLQLLLRPARDPVRPDSGRTNGASRSSSTRPTTCSNARADVLGTARALGAERRAPCGAAERDEGARPAGASAGCELQRSQVEPHRCLGGCRPASRDGIAARSAPQSPTILPTARRNTAARYCDFHFDALHFLRIPDRFDEHRCTTSLDVSRRVGRRRDIDPCSTFATWCRARSCGAADSPQHMRACCSRRRWRRSRFPSRHPRAAADTAWLIVRRSDRGTAHDAGRARCCRRATRDRGASLAAIVDVDGAARSSARTGQPPRVLQQLRLPRARRSPPPRRAIPALPCWSAVAGDGAGGARRLPARFTAAGCGDRIRGARRIVRRRHRPAGPVA